jgi:molybdopterin synthase sulfur carrier subunit
MEINFYATLRQITGQKTVRFEMPNGVTVQEMMDVVLERYPAMREVMFDEEGNLYGHVHVFINGRDAPYLDNELETIISADDKVDIFPAVGGGAGCRPQG